MTSFLGPLFYRSTLYLCLPQISFGDCLLSSLLELYHMLFLLSIQAIGSFLCLFEDVLINREKFSYASESFATLFLFLREQSTAC